MNDFVSTGSRQLDWMYELTEVYPVSIETVIELYNSYSFPGLPPSVKANRKRQKTIQFFKKYFEK